MKIKVNLLNETFSPYSPSSFGDSETKKFSYNKRHFFPMEMETFNYLFDREYKLYKPVTDPVFILSKGRNYHVKPAKLNKVDFQYLLENSNSWHSMNTEFDRKDIENFTESQVKILFGIDLIQWNILKNVIEKLELDFSEVYLQVILSIEKLVKYSLSGRKTEDDLLFRFERFFYAKNYLFSNHLIKDKEEEEDDDDNDNGNYYSNDIIVSSMLELIFSIRNDLYSLPSVYKDLLEYKPVLSKKRKKSSKKSI